MILSRAPVLLLALLGCQQPALPPPPDASDLPRRQEEVPVRACPDRAALRASYGQECRVVGTYRLKAFPSKGGDTLDDWPVVALDDGSEVMLESIWDKTKRPTPQDLQRWTGQRVEVAGTLHSGPPKLMPENFGFPCLSPVRRIGLAAK